MSTHSKYTVSIFGIDGSHRGGFRLKDNQQDERFAEELKNGNVLIVSENLAASMDLKPLKRDESAMFSDMTYEACRERYQVNRNKILDRINAGSISASMSGIESYHHDWDEIPPDQFDYLESAMTWNGVTHIKTDWIDVLMAKHPLSPTSRRGTGL